jgi:dihydroorotate dehydrogenase
MYKRLIRPLFFLFHPEFIHEVTFKLIRIGFYIPGIKTLINKIYCNNNPDLERKVFGIKFKNPIGLAAGFDKNAVLFDELSAFGFSFIEIGTLTPKAQPGNPKPRVFRVPPDKALINRMGFNNEGLKSAVIRLKKRKTEVIIGGNIGKNKITPNEEAISDYEKGFEALFDVVDYFVVNVSSPNTPNLRKLQEKEPLKKLLSRLQELNNLKTNRKPILLKIAPDLTNEQLDDIIEIVFETGIDGIVATNTTISRDGLSISKNEIEKMGAGGLSGLPLKERSTEVIRYLSQKSNKKIPIIGVGGINTAADAIEKLEAGASLIQVFTGFIYEGPGIVNQINKELSKKGL